MSEQKTTLKPPRWYLRCHETRRLRTCSSDQRRRRLCSILGSAQKGWCIVELCIMNHDADNDVLWDRFYKRLKIVRLIEQH